jgi:hypothetical protein
MYSKVSRPDSASVPDHENVRELCHVAGMSVVSVGTVRSRLM